MAETNNKYDLLSVGHVSHDLLENKYILGGSVSYASAFASSIGKKSAIVTSFGKDFQFQSFFEENNIALFNQFANATSIFQNVYIGGDRWQYLRSRADDISKEFILEQSIKSDTLLLCPIANEINIDVLTALHNPLIGMTIQGCLRQWDEEGKISPKAMDWEKLSKADFVFLSYEDIGNEKQIISKLKDLGNTIIITNDQLGADVFFNGENTNFPCWPTSVVDPTGAGDTFATAFLLKYKESQDLATSIVYGHSAASLIIEQVGMEYSDMPDKIDQRSKAYRLKYNI